MDTKRFFTPENLQNFYRSLSYKLSLSPPIDLLLVADDNAASFAMEHRQTLFNEIPIVFFGVNSPERAKALGAEPGVTGIVEDISMDETIDLIIRLHPDLKRIVAIADGTVTGQSDLKRFYQNKIKHNSVALDAISLQHVSFEQLQVQLNRLDNKSAVLLISAFKDKFDKVLSFEDSLKMIRTHTTRPIYHLWRHGLGEGILGGKVVDHFQQGKKAAELAKQILAGKSPDSIPVVMNSPNVFMFDYKELERFGIKLSELPADRIIINRPEDFYTTHKNLVWATCSAILVLSLFIFFLSVNIARRKKAEQALKQSHDLLEKTVETRTEALTTANADLHKEIIERKRAEQAARDLTGKLEAAQQLGKSGWWEYDVQNDRLIWPDESYALFGLDPKTATITSKSLLQYVDAEFHQEYTQRLKRLYAEGAADIQYPIRRPDGQRRWIWAKGEAKYDEQGNALRLFGAMRDVTERVEIEEQLRLQAQIIRQVHDSVISVDKEGTITSWNKGSERLFHYSAQEAIGNHVAMIYPETLHERLRNHILPTLLSQGNLEIEGPLLRKGKQPFEAMISLSVLRNESGDVTGMIGYTLDVTRAKKVEQEREQLIGELKEALAKVKTLSGFLPICSACKKIRDDQGYWKQIESYISEHSQAEFSHSVCPECAKKLYPEYWKRH